MRLFAIAVVLACFVPSSALAGDVTGVVRYTGPAPSQGPLRVTKDQPTCGDEVPDDSLFVKDGKLVNAVVSVGAVGPPAPPAKIVLDQRKCRFVPRVLTAPVGSTVEIVNSDDILHNAHGWNGKATVFNVPMPDAGQRAPKPLKKAGLVKVGCDVHAWMGAWIFVSEGPAAVTGEDGGFRLRGLPAGAYTVKVWHERLGEITAPVTVPAEGDARLDVALPAR